MRGILFDSIKFINKKFNSIKSGNNLFELIIFICSFYDVAIASYILDHILYNLPITAIFIYGSLGSAFIKIILMLLFDEKGLSK
jgi:hypothetical protein